MSHSLNYRASFLCLTFSLGAVACAVDGEDGSLDSNFPIELGTPDVSSGQTGDEGAVHACELSESTLMPESTAFGATGLELRQEALSRISEELSWPDGSKSVLSIAFAEDPFLEEREVRYYRASEKCEEAIEFKVIYHVTTDDGRLDEIANGVIRLTGRKEGSFGWVEEESNLEGRLRFAEFFDEAKCIDRLGVENENCSSGTLLLTVDFTPDGNTGKLEVVPRWKNGSEELSAW